MTKLETLAHSPQDSITFMFCSAIGSFFLFEGPFKLDCVTNALNMLLLAPSTCRSFRLTTAEAITTYFVQTFRHSLTVVVHCIIQVLS